MALTVVALLILGRLYVSTQPGDRTRVTALALVCGGAIGNLIDRIRSGRGVVDFLDVGVGSARWPTFNMADVAVSTGAFLLAIVLWAEEQPSHERPQMEIAAAGGSSAGGELRHETSDAS
jgi:signal peptidase II